LIFPEFCRNGRVLKASKRHDIKGFAAAVIFSMYLQSIDKWFSGFWAISWILGDP
jgi:hypothetical protein